MTPILSLLLVHDHLFAKGGIAAPSGHPLRQAVEKHKARLHAEFTKARLRRKCVTVEELKEQLLREKPPQGRSQPRWIRVNTLKTSLADQLATTFQGYRVDGTISEVTESPRTAKILAIDRNVPDIVALPPDADFTKTQAYKDGKLILQDKASCFPAYLLAGERDNQMFIRDCIDGCAAPGNKTSHLAALLASTNKPIRKIFACERDLERSKTLKRMIERSGADAVVVLSGQDFLTVDVHHLRHKDVTHLLLDPSCSGSGILGRADIPVLALPLDTKTPNGRTSTAERNSKKRKRIANETREEEVADDGGEVEESRDPAPDKMRLQRLSSMQTRIVEHAFAFPAATRVTYSTCSVHVEENESVVSRVLASDIARSRGWRVLRREEQVIGLREWNIRGIPNPDTTLGGLEVPVLNEEEREGCIRCQPGDEEGTMGFFVCGFVRSSDNAAPELAEADDGWEGFSD